MADESDLKNLKEIENCPVIRVSKISHLKLMKNQII